jgi:CheY-like chemotaxis protein
MTKLVKEAIRQSQYSLRSPSVLEHVAIILREDYGVRIWHLVGRDAVAAAEAVCRAIARLRPAFVGTPELHALGRMVRAPDWGLRRAAAQSLAIIAGGERYARCWRLRAVRRLLHVLRREADPAVRGDAIVCFEDNETADLTATARKIADWWREQKDAAHARTILWSEDEFVICLAIKMQLASQGFKHVYLERTALGTLERAKELQPALIGTDIGKPGMDGIEMTRIIKDDPSLARIPVLMVTGYLEDHWEHAAKLFCGHLSKPVLGDELGRTVAMAIAGNFSETTGRTGQ